MVFIKKSISIFSQELIIRMKEIIILLLDKFGFNEIFRHINKKKLIILFYHGITENEGYLNPYHIPKSKFEKQILYLKKKKYNFISLMNWINIIKTKQKLKNNNVIITFDDGYKNVIDNAYPILIQHGIKGCLYIVSYIIGTNQFLWSDFIDVFLRNYEKPKFRFIIKGKQIEYPLNSENEINKSIHKIQLKLTSLKDSERLAYLEQFNKPNKINGFKKTKKDYFLANWKDIKNLARNILEIGSHTKTHPNLNKISNDKELTSELSDSKVIIEKKIGYPVKHLCYPHGAYNEKVIQKAKELGYLTGVTGDRGFNTINTDLFQLKRMMGYNDFTLFKANISGLYLFLNKILNKVKRKQNNKT